MNKDNYLPDCWEIEKCGEEKGGFNVGESGECIAAKEGLGHSCWAIAGTLCKGEVQGAHAQKLGFCTACDVYKLYNRINGTKGKDVILHYPEEDSKYMNLMCKRSEERNL